MATYSAYFDESGHPDDSKVMVVAGAIADVQQWVHFEREWKGLLAGTGTHIFHANKFHQGRPPFDRLSESDADDLFAKLIGVICRRVEQTISKAIRLSEYQAMNDRYVLAELYGYPYGLCARSCIGKVEEWASRHSIPVSEIGLFFEDGAQDKGQLEWIAERDGLPAPVRLQKERDIPLQAGDLIAWCHNIVLSGGVLAERYQRGLDELYKRSSEWELIQFTDPDRLPTILGIPKRDSGSKYKCTIIKKDGRRHALVHYWDKNKIEPKVERKTLTVPKRMSKEEVFKAAAEYDASRSKVGT